MEEWGCNLGEDVFLSEEEMEVPLGSLDNFRDADGMKDCQNDVDNLVDDLNADWLKNKDVHDGNFKDQECCPSVVNKGVTMQQLQQFQHACSSVPKVPSSLSVLPSNSDQLAGLGSFAYGSGMGKKGKQAVVHYSSSKSKKSKKKHVGTVLNIQRVLLKGLLDFLRKIENRF